MQTLSPTARLAKTLAGATAPPRNAYTPPPAGSLQQQALQLKKQCTRKALLGASSSLIPIPLIDLAVDAVLLTKMLQNIHEAFGLSEAHINALDPAKRQRTYAAIQFVGNRVIGRVVTTAVVSGMVRGIGVKLTAQQVSKVVPIAGQLASATLNYITMRTLIHKHIDDCVRVLERTRHAP